MTFKEGGAFDFYSTYERIKETLSQAFEVARESGQVAGNTNQVPAIDISTVHLEQLPAYEEIGGTVPAPGPQLQQPIPVSPPRTRRAPLRDSGVVFSSDDEQNTRSTVKESSTEQFQPPSEPPPGYEETQQNSIADNLEQTVRRASRN